MEGQQVRSLGCHKTVINASKGNEESMRLLKLVLSTHTISRHSVSFIHPSIPPFHAFEKFQPPAMRDTIIHVRRKCCSGRSHYERFYVVHDDSAPMVGTLYREKEVYSF